MERRKFLKTAGVFATTFYASRFPVIAGPFAPGQLGGGQIPVDKKLDPAWIKSLYERGTPTRYLSSKNELKFIGMPVGGIQTGMLYLGGDGRLWLWDIFNDNRNGVDTKVIPWETEVHVGKKIRAQDGANYVSPPTDIRPVDQGFAFEIKVGNKRVVKKMIATDWDEIVFEATYPVATVSYIDKQLPVQIIAEVFSPFIALDEKNSGLPVTIYSFKIKNNSSEKVEVRISGWLENKTCISHNQPELTRVNAPLALKSGAALVYSIHGSADKDFTNLADYGTMALASLDKGALTGSSVQPENISSLFEGLRPGESRTSANQKLTGCVVSTHKIDPGMTADSNFLISWHFVNLTFKEIPDRGRYYNTLFKSAGEVIGYVAKNFEMLTSNTRLWKETFYDSSLPWWFLERTLLNISTLATTTSHRMESGRYYAWEGIGCCPGTCTHVWQYAHAPARIFPSMERDIRQRIDLGLSLQDDGSMWYRCEADKRPAVDGQAGTILRFYREHQMCNDSQFLQSNWSKIKRTIQYLISLDKNGDGMEDTPVENTLDAMWDGEIAWIVGLCIAAVKAGEMMALEMEDAGFAEKCRQYVAAGRTNMEEKLFNGEYFIHLPDAEKGRARLGSYNTCHIDQVYGQSWAHQAGLGRILDQEKTITALRSLWKYNFTPDVGPYIKEHTGGRPYALAGEGGMIMNSNPKNEAKPYGDNVTWQLGYFHECMSGFEHQVAAHMMAEGMTDESLVLTRMIHDRYHAAKRNPFNEVECSDHYARAMASYGTFITACGFEYHGPRASMRFAPRIGAGNFKAPFTTAQGWGTFVQQKDARHAHAELLLKYGTLRLRRLQLEVDHHPTKVEVTANGKKIGLTIGIEGQKITIEWNEEIVLKAGEKIEITVN